MIALLLLACGRGDCELSEPVLDQCDVLCITAKGASESAVLRSGLDGEVPVAVDGDQVCVEGPLSVGLHRLTLSDGDERCELVAEVRPFGWAYGLEKPLEALAELPWVPEIEGLDEPPVLEPDPSSWDAVNVSMPSRVDFGGESWLFYAGSDGVDPYQLGAAALEDGLWVRRLGPLLNAEATGSQAGDWDFDGQNTPNALVVDGELQLFYNGRDDALTTLSIGRATSADGVAFSPDGAVLRGGGVTGDFDRGAVAHASVLQREGRDGPVWEMWYASGTLEIGYALSSDGLQFERSCDGPVFGGLGAESWDAGQVKAPEVVFAEDLYWMSYSGCGKGCYEVGWAASADGQRWVAAEAPVLAAGGAGWSALTTQGADVEVDGDVWRFWYAGSDGETTAIGVGQATQQ